MYKFIHVEATSLAEATAALAKGGAQVMAGGTDLLTYMKGMFTPNPPSVLVNIKGISPSLAYIKEESGQLKIGALTTLTAIANSPLVKGSYAVLAQAALAAATPELRNMGTIGGNICQKPRCIYYRHEYNTFPCQRKSAKGVCYAAIGVNTQHSIFGAVDGCYAACPSDLAPALVALGASIMTTKKTIPAEGFFSVKGEQINILDADEIVTEIQVPALAAGSKSVYKKFAFRKAIDFPLVSVAAVVVSSGGTVSRASIVLGGVHNTPRRATEAENYIKGKAIDAATGDAAGAAAVASAKSLAQNKYKVQITRVLIKRALLAVK